MNNLPFPDTELPPARTISNSELNELAAAFRANEEKKLQQKLEILKPHMAAIKKFESSWDDITLSRFKENGLSDEIKWAWWDVVCTNRKLLKTIGA